MACIVNRASKNVSPDKILCTQCGDELDNTIDNIDDNICDFCDNSQKCVKCGRIEYKELFFLEDSDVCIDCCQSCASCGEVTKTLQEIESGACNDCDLTTLKCPHCNYALSYINYGYNYDPWCGKCEKCINLDGPEEFDGYREEGAGEY